MTASFKVLFFDSGMGGLSVYREVMNVSAHYISPIYLFDNAFCPFGNKPDEFVCERVTNLMKFVAETLSPDLIVIACNTASTVALEAVRKAIKIPVVGVVPAIKPAAKLTLNKTIALLATPATIGREYTKKLIEDFAQGVDVLKIGSTELVELAEQKIRGESIDRQVVVNVVKPWLELSKKPDVIVLGCTHFPLIREEIEALFPNSLLVDSGAAIARRVKTLLANMTSNKEEHQMPICYCTKLSEVPVALISALKNRGFSDVIELTKA